jgi:hypothetical protein
MKQGSFFLFCFCIVMLRSPKPWQFHCRTLGIFGKLLMSSIGALTWFETVWSCGVEAIEY